MVYHDILYLSIPNTNTNIQRQKLQQQNINIFIKFQIALFIVGFPKGSTHTHTKLNLFAQDHQSVALAQI